MTTTLPPLLADQLPSELQVKQAILHQLRTELDRFAYMSVNTPLIEHADLFLIKAGDAAINRLVSFELTGQTLCLRPEFTAPAARVYTEHFQDKPGTVRLQFAGSILQYESLRHGEITQQQAVGAELINEHSPEADAEIIALTGRLLEAAGVSDWRLTIGHSGLIERLLDRYGLNRQMRRFVLAWLPALRAGGEGLQRAADALDTVLLAPTAHAEQFPPALEGDINLALQALMRATPQRGPSGGRTQEEIARRLLDKQQYTDQRSRALRALADLQQILLQAATHWQLLEHLQGDPLQPMAEGLTTTFDLLAAYRLPPERITLDLSFTRNLDYYTGIVFEYRTPPAAGSHLFGGGGRYDELIGLLGARQRVPAVGFMLYVEALLNHRTGSAASERPQPHLVLRGTNAEAPGGLIAYADQLRTAGLAVTTDLTGQALPGTATHILTVRSSGEALVKPLADPSREVSLAAGDIAQIVQTVEATT